MKFISTRKGIEATGPETVFQGLAPDGGLYVPAGPLCNSGIAELNEADSSQANSSMVNGESHNSTIPQSHNSTIPQSPLLAQAESFVLGRLFDDFPEEVRTHFYRHNDGSTTTPGSSVHTAFFGKIVSSYVVED